jgi:hypothetical protein
MSEWSVLVGVEDVRHRITEEHVDRLMDLLHGPHGAAIAGPGDEVTVRLTVEADEAWAAAREAQDIVTAALRRVSGARFPVVRLEAVTHELLDLELGL